MIGPCGHTYGIKNGRWSHITMRGSSIRYSYVYLKNYRTGKLFYLTSKNTGMKIDGSGSLWYSTDMDIGYYNPFSKTSSYFDLYVKTNYGKKRVQQIDFLKGNVYGVV